VRAEVGWVLGDFWSRDLRFCPEMVTEYACGLGSNRGSAGGYGGPLVRPECSGARDLQALILSVL